jgi:hypothetical protein
MEIVSDANSALEVVRTEKESTKSINNLIYKVKKRQR